MATDRYIDLLKQGFMKPLKPARQAKAKEMISCTGCLNWHWKGKHTEPDKAVRKANAARFAC